MKIDIFNHVFPKSFFDRYIVSGAAGKEIGKRMANATIGFDLDQRFRILDEFQDVRQVITLGQPPIEALGGPKESPAIAREANDGLAELVAKHPDRFIAFAASLPLNNADASLDEMTRAIDQLGAKGVMIFRFGCRSKTPENTRRAIAAPVSYGQPSAHQISNAELSSLL